MMYTIDDGKLDPILKQSLLDDRYYNNHAFKVLQLNLMINKKFNYIQYQEETAVNDPNGNIAATNIQANFKGHTVRQEQGLYYFFHTIYVFF